MKLTAIAKRHRHFPDFLMMKIGALYLGNRDCEFTVWSPLRQQVAVKILTPETHLIPMQRDEWGYWTTIAADIDPGTLYIYELDGNITHPDPASYSQPQDVHGPSQVIDHAAFNWQDSNWSSIPLEDLIIYELHPGTFTPEGTFAAIIPRLEALRQLGINAIELMPVAQFPGDRNWGYDGVYPFAAQHSYGGPDGLKQLVNACHQCGIAVILDVVYNHLGPEGNYSSNFAPYFTHKYHTPWGSAVNFDGAYSYGVRQFFLENALYWLRHYHIDALRLDAIHAIYDFSAKHFLEELAEAVEEFSQQQGRKFYLIAESDLNDVRILIPQSQGGYNMDAQWSDDFHHALHTLLTPEKQGYYQDFGQCKHLEKAFRESFVYAGNYSPYRQRYHGNYSGNLPASKFVVFAQNHDQVGNRMGGERLSQLVSFEGLKLAAGTLLLSPYIPLLFMGEEYGEENPFLYFISHHDPDLVAAVRQGRKAEFAEFYQSGEPPDADSLDTFRQCQLNWEKRTEGKHQVLLQFYQTLIQRRRESAALKYGSREQLSVTSREADQYLYFRRWYQNHQVFCVLNFNQSPITLQNPVAVSWKQQIDSADPQWLGPGSHTPSQLNEGERLTLSPQSFVLYETE